MIFLAVYRHGSTLAASEQVFLSQSAVSIALSTLEKQLGTLLFDRTGKHLVANSQAELLKPYAEKVVKGAKAIEDLFEGMEGSLKIGASSTIGNYLLPKLMREFEEEYGHLDVTLEIHNTDRICRGLLNCEYNIGLIEGVSHYCELKTDGWIEDEMVLFCAADSRLDGLHKSRLDINDLQQYRLVVRERGSATRDALEHLILRRTEVDSLFELGSNEAVKQAVVNDMGIGFLSRLEVEDLLELKKIKLLPLKNGPKLTRQLYLACYPGKHPTLLKDNFEAFCLNYAQREATENKTSPKRPKPKKVS